MRSPCPYQGRSLVSCDVVELLANPKDSDMMVIDREDGSPPLTMSRGELRWIEQSLKGSTTHGDRAGTDRDML